jgi:hypothetical protein
MILPMKLIWFPVLLSLASCVSPANSCAGWKAISTDKAQTVDWLASNDPAFLRQVIAHQEFGQSQRCW